MDRSNTRGRGPIVAVAVVVAATVIVVLFGFGQAGPAGQKCSTLVTTEVTGTFFPYSTQTTTYTTAGTVVVTFTLTAGGTVEEYTTTTSVSCGS